MIFPTLFTLVAALVPFTAVPQAGPAGPQVSAQAAGGWKELDSVVLVINEDIVTSRAINRALAGMRRDRPMNSDSDLRAALLVLQASMLERIVAAQAGENLGIDPAAVERQLKHYQEYTIERVGGVANLAELYKQNDLNTQDAKVAIRQGFFVELYEDYVTGKGPGAKQRISRDTYVRPGQLMLSWEDLRDRPTELADLGGAPRTVVLQRIDIDAREVGGADAARRLALQLRQRIVAGEDMETLGAEFGAKSSPRGLSPALDETKLGEKDPQLGDFLARAKENELSQVLAPPQAQSTLFGLVRLVKRMPAVIPDFRSAKVQHALRQRNADDLAKYRKLQALEALYAASYVWPAPVLSKAMREKQP